MRTPISSPFPIVVQSFNMTIKPLKFSFKAVRLGNLVILPFCCNFGGVLSPPDWHPRPQCCLGDLFDE